MNSNSLFTMARRLDITDESGPIIKGIFNKTATPVIFSKYTYETDRIVNVVSRMPVNQQKSSWSTFQVYSRDLKVESYEEFRPVIFNTDKTISSWDMYIATVHNDSVTYMFEDKNNFLKTFRNIKALSNNYKYKNMFETNNNWAGLIALLKECREDVIFTISLYKLKEFSPIYVTDKIDSIGIAVEVLDKRDSYACGLPISIQNFYLIFSNHKENLFYMDGIAIQPYNTTINLKHAVSTYLEVFKAVSGVVKGKGRPAKQKDRSMGVYGKVTLSHAEAVFDYKEDVPLGYRGGVISAKASTPKTILRGPGPVAVPEQVPGSSIKMSKQRKEAKGTRSQVYKEFTTEHFSNDMYEAPYNSAAEDYARHIGEKFAKKSPKKSKHASSMSISDLKREVFESIDLEKVEDRMVKMEGRVEMGKLKTVAFKEVSRHKKLGEEMINTYKERM